MSNAPQTPPEHGAPTEPEAEGGVAPQVERAVDQVRVRRAPKYPVFIFGGIILGIIVTFVAVSVAPGRNDDSTPFLQAFGYFVLYGIAIGAVVGSLLAIIIDAISNRRARRVETERVTVDPDPDRGSGHDSDSGSDAGEIEQQL